MHDMPPHAYYTGSVTAIRTSLHAHRGAFAALVATAGFMTVLDGGRMIVRVCNMADASTMVMEIPGLKHDPTDQQVQSRCAFADLALPTLPGADPIQLAALAAPVVARGLRFAIAQ